MLLVRSQDIVVPEEANPLEVVPEVVIRQFSESLAHNVQPLLGSGLGRIEKSKSSNMNLTQMGFKVAHKMKAIL